MKSQLDFFAFAKSLTSKPSSAELSESDDDDEESAFTSLSSPLLSSIN